MSVKVVTIGGGGGHSAVVKALKDLPIELTALCNTVDDGGGSGKLVREYKVHSPGDTRQVLAALAENGRSLNYRFSGGHLDGQTVGNMLLAGLELSTQSVQQAIDTVRSCFGIEHHVAPLTENIPTLHARSVSGREIMTQAELVHFVRTQNDPVETLWLDPAETTLSTVARTALQEADYIIIAMGDLYSSIAPALCINELKSLWPTLKAKIIWLPNVAVTPGHVHYQTISTALSFLQSLLPEFVPNIIVTHDQVLPAGIQKALQEKSYGISVSDVETNEKIVVMRQDLLDEDYFPVQTVGDVVDRSPIRYDIEKLKNIFEKILV